MNTDTNPWLITPDLSQAVELTNEGVTPGIYNARVTNLELKPTKAGDASYIKWTLTLFGAEGELAKFNNWKVYHNTMTSGKGAGMLKTFFKACTGQELSGAFDFSLLVGSEVQLTLVEGKKQDGSPSTFPEVKAVKSLVQ